MVRVDEKLKQDKV